MKVTDAQLREVWDQGFTVVEDFVPPEGFKRWAGHQLAKLHCPNIDTSPYKRLENIRSFYAQSRNAGS